MSTLTLRRPTLTAEKVDEALEALVRRAEASLGAFWPGIVGLPALEKRAALEAFWPELVNTYGDTAATIAADRFEELTGFDARLAPEFDPGDLNARMRWGIDPVFDATPNDAAALARLAKLLDEFIFDASRATTVSSADEAGMRWARAPRPGACAWCIMLGSRGYDYHSKKAAMTATANGHNGCRCRIVVEGEDAPGYDPDSLLDIYTRATADVGASNPKTILARMREQGHVGDKHKPKKK